MRPVRYRGQKDKQAQNAHKNDPAVWFMSFAVHFKPPFFSRLLRGIVLSHDPYFTGFESPPSRCFDQGVLVEARITNEVSACVCLPALQKGGATAICA